VTLKISDDDVGERPGRYKKIITKLIIAAYWTRRLHPLQLALPRDVVMNNVLPFLDCHHHTFKVADHGDEEDDSDGEKEEE